MMNLGPGYKSSQFLDNFYSNYDNRFQNTVPKLASMGRSFSQTDVSRDSNKYSGRPNTFNRTEGTDRYREYGGVQERPMSSYSKPYNRTIENSGGRPSSSGARRLSFSLHDLHRPWTGNTNMINGFYEEPTQDSRVEHRYLDDMRRRRERETDNLASGINFQYSSPYMSEGHSLVKASSQSSQY